MLTTTQQRLVDHVLNGGMPKRFAIENHMHPNTAQKILNGLGIRKVFVTEDENRALIEMRKLMKPMTESKP